MPAVNPTIAAFLVNFYAGRDCGVPARLAELRERELARLRTDAAALPAAASRRSTVTLPVCPSRGPLITGCPCLNPDLDVYHCEHESEPEWSRCTPGLNDGADADLASCETCPLHPSRAKP